MYIMGLTPSKIPTGENLIVSYDKKNPKSQYSTQVYVTSAGLADLTKNSDHSLNKANPTDKIPFTFASSGLSTLCRDFDVDLSDLGNNVKAYVAMYYMNVDEAREHGLDVDAPQMHMQQLQDAEGNELTYIPSREGKDNYTFHGVVLRNMKTDKKTYYYRIGENDYTTSAQTTLNAVQTKGNRLTGAVITKPITMQSRIDGKQYTSFVLNGGKFKYLSEDIDLTWTKAYLLLPTETVGTLTNQKAKGLTFVWDDAQTPTGIVTLPTKASDTDAYYTLSGVRVAHPTKGIYIHQGKKILVK